MEGKQIMHYYKDLPDLPMWEFLELISGVPIYSCCTECVTSSFSPLAGIIHAAEEKDWKTAYSSSMRLLKARLYWQSPCHHFTQVHAPLQDHAQLVSPGLSSVSLFFSFFSSFKLIELVKPVLSLQARGCAGPDQWKACPQTCGQTGRCLSWAHPMVQLCNTGIHYIWNLFK